jgi:hypothetical protein
MSDEFQHEIAFGLENLERVKTTLLQIARQDLPLFVMDPALAYECVGYYNASEHLMLRFVKHQKLPKPSGAATHKDTLRLFEEIATRQGVVIDKSQIDYLVQLMGFRHIATKIYGFLIDHARLILLVESIEQNHEAWKELVTHLAAKPPSAKD